MRDDLPRVVVQQDVAREVVRAVTQPRNVWIDTIELQPNTPQKKKGVPK